MVRLKNKLKEKQAPFNLHVNAIFHPSEVEDPIIIEAVHLREVYKLQHRQHIAYKMKRAELISARVAQLYLIAQSIVHGK